MNISDGIFHIKHAGEWRVIKEFVKDVDKFLKEVEEFEEYDLKSTVEDEYIIVEFE